MVSFNKIRIRRRKRAYHLRNYHLYFQWKYVGLSIHN